MRAAGADLGARVRSQALGLVDEARFAQHFDAGNGRPNKSVRLVVGVLVLKEVFDLTDDEALERWSGTQRGTMRSMCCPRRPTHARRRCTISARCCWTMSGWAVREHDGATYRSSGVVHEAAATGFDAHPVSLGMNYCISIDTIRYSNYGEIDWPNQPR